MSDERLVPVRAERYEVLRDIVCAAIREHADPLVRGGHGRPAVDCDLCTTLRRLCGNGSPELGSDERAYLDEMHPRKPAGVAR